MLVAVCWPSLGHSVEANDKERNQWYDAPGCRNESLQESELDGKVIVVLSLSCTANLLYLDSYRRVSKLNLIPFGKRVT
jgi:hypothetical protein